MAGGVVFMVGTVAAGRETARWTTVVKHDAVPTLLGMKARTKPVGYDDSPDRLTVPISLEEIDLQLHAGAKGLARSQKSVVHLLRRMGLTLQQNKNHVNNMARLIEEAGRRQAAGIGGSLSPRDAVRFLSPEDRRALFESTANEVLKAAAQKEEAAAAAERAFRSAVATAELCLTELRDRPDLAGEPKAAVTRALAQIAELTQYTSPRPAAAPAPQSSPAHDDLDELFED